MVTGFESCSRDSVPGYYYLLMARSVAVGYCYSKSVTVDAVAAIVAAGDSAAVTVVSVHDYLELGEAAFGFHDEPVADDPIRICVGVIDQFLPL